MIWLTHKSLYSGEMFSGLIGLESASAYFGLCSAPPNPLLIYTTFYPKIETEFIITIPTEKVDYTDTIHLGYDLYVTDPYRTIYDMILYKTTGRFLYESLDRFGYLFDYSRLVEYMNSHNLGSLFEEIEKEKHRYFEDD